VIGSSASPLFSAGDEVIIQPAKSPRPFPSLAQSIFSEGQLLSEGDVSDKELEEDLLILGYEKRKSRGFICLVGSSFVDEWSRLRRHQR
jgi:hypothetical protein